MAHYLTYWNVNAKNDDDGDDNNINNSSTLTLNITSHPHNSSPNASQHVERGLQLSQQGPTDHYDV